MSACLSTSIEIYMPYTHASSCIISPKRFDSVQHTAHQTLSLDPRAISVKFRILQKEGMATLGNLLSNMYMNMKALS